MPTKIDYQGLGAGEKLVAYCKESPQEVLGRVFREFRVWEYNGQQNLLVPVWPGLIIRNTEASEPGTTITGSIDSLEVFSSIPDRFYPPKHKNPLTDDDVRREIARHIATGFTYRLDDDPNPKNNYMVRFDDPAERKNREEIFLELDMKAEFLLQATSVMLGIGSKDGLRDLFKEFYWKI
ncbi:MAG: hypothetical protein AABX47_01600 [Nanoarchaeota archaeon]